MKEHQTLALVRQIMTDFAAQTGLEPVCREPRRYQAVGDDIEKFWHEAANRQAETWRAHGDINMVMQATSLAPDGFLLLG